MYILFASMWTSRWRHHEFKIHCKLQSFTNMQIQTETGDEHLYSVLSVFSHLEEILSVVTAQKKRWWQLETRIPWYQASLSLERSAAPRKSPCASPLVRASLFFLWLRCVLDQRCLGKISTLTSLWLWRTLLISPVSLVYSCCAVKASSPAPLTPPSTAYAHRLFICKIPK